MIRKLFATAVIGCFACQQTFADLAPLPIKVEGKIVGTGLDTGGKKGKEVQEKKLQIELTTLSSKEFGSLQVTCIFYARNLKDDKTVVEKQLNLATTLNKGQATLDTPEEDFLSHQTHYERAGHESECHSPGKEEAGREGGGHRPRIRGVGGFGSMLRTTR
ncbi:MAG: hypothetical protein QM755_16555 [Luteolibacter sp.]